MTGDRAGDPCGRGVREICGGPGHLEPAVAGAELPRLRIGVPVLHLVEVDGELDDLGLAGRQVDLREADELAFGLLGGEVGTRVAILRSGMSAGPMSRRIIQMGHAGMGPLGAFLEVAISEVSGPMGGPQCRPKTEPVVGSVWRSLESVSQVLLAQETRVFFANGSGRWQRSWRWARALSATSTSTSFDFVFAGRSVPTIRSRCSSPEQNETPRYRDLREPVRRLLLAERSATASASAVGSSGIDLHAHQVGAALRILRDPVQRYSWLTRSGWGRRSRRVWP